MLGGCGFPAIFNGDFGVGECCAAATVFSVLSGFAIALDGDHGGGFGHAVGEAKGDFVLGSLGE